MRKFFITFLIVLGFVGLVFINPALSDQKKMSGTECLAPAGAGGGWDFTCRVPAAQLMQKLDLIDGAMKVVNMSGSGGGKAFSYVVNTRNTDENLIVAASAATATRLAQKVYGDFKADDVRWVGALGMDYGVLVVAMVEQHDEFLTAKTCDHVALAKAAIEQAARVCQHLVAGIVAEPPEVARPQPRCAERRDRYQHRGQQQAQTRVAQRNPPRQRRPPPPVHAAS